MLILELYKHQLESLLNLFFQGKTAALNGDGSELSDDTFANDDNLPEGTFEKVTRSQNCSWFLVHPSETFEYLSSVLAKSGTFQEYWSEIYEVNVNEVNDILVMGNSDEILEDTVEPPGCNDT